MPIYDSEWEHEDHKHAEWKAQVANDETELGYNQWVYFKMEQEIEESEDDDYDEPTQEIDTFSDADPGL